MVQFSRRQALTIASLNLALLTQTGSANAEMQKDSATIKPQRLHKGDRIALIAPATAIYDKVDIGIATEALQALGLEVVPGKNVLNRFGYLAGTDKERADDFNRAFQDPSIKGVFAIRGGWGASRMLPFVDFDRVAANPKVFIGYSDITSLINAAYSKTGLVTFHGPNALSPWSEFSTREMKSIVFHGRAPFMKNPTEKGPMAITIRSIGQALNRPGAQSARAAGRITMANLSYNFRRLVFHERRQPIA